MTTRVPPVAIVDTRRRSGLMAALSLGAGWLLAPPGAGRANETDGWPASWLIRIAAENRSRLLTVRGAQRLSDTQWQLDALYGWTDSAMIPVQATLNSVAGGFQLVVVPQANVELVVQSADLESFTGTLRSASGELRQITLKRTRNGASVSASTSPVPFPVVPPPMMLFASEDRDWSVATSASAKRAPYNEATPTSAPGARVIRTLELKALLEINRAVILIDVHESPTRRTVPGAYWLFGAGDGRFYGAEKSRLERTLERLTSANKYRALVVIGHSSENWLGYNATLHILEAGYHDVIWYRGGSEAWRSAGLELATPERVNW